MMRSKLFLAKLFYNWLYSLRGWDEVATNNYGLAPVSPFVEREAGAERYQIQMYQSLVEFGGLEEWDKYSILEIGCGRGGGLRHVVKWLRPKEIIGLDSSKAAIAFCNKTQVRFPYPISYLRGDAHRFAVRIETVSRGDQRRGQPSLCGSGQVLQRSSSDPQR